MKTKIFYFIFFILTLQSCDFRDKKVKYSGFALLSYVTNSDYKTMQIVKLSEYKTSEKIDFYVDKHNLKGINISIKPNNSSYSKVLNYSQLQNYKNYNDFYLVKIEFEIERIDIKWVKEEESYISIFDKIFKLKNVSYSNLKDDVNIIDIKNIKYL